MDGLTLLVPPGCVVEIDGRAGDEPEVRTHRRRYCSLACQNRIKAAAYRSRQSG